MLREAKAPRLLEDVKRAYVGWKLPNLQKQRVESEWSEPIRVKWDEMSETVRVQIFVVQGNLGAVYYNFPHAGAVSGFFDGPAGLPILWVNIELNIELCSGVQAKNFERVFGRVWRCFCIQLLYFPP